MKKDNLEEDTNIYKKGNFVELVVLKEEGITTFYLDLLSKNLTVNTFTLVEDEDYEEEYAVALKDFEDKFKFLEKNIPKVLKKIQECKDLLDFYIEGGENVELDVSDFS